MTFRFPIALATIILAAAICTQQTLAQEDPEDLMERAQQEVRERLLGDDDDAAAEAPATPEVPPDMEAMMEAWTQANTPGPQHERLAWFEGEWTTQASHWMGPGEPQTSSGKSSMKMVLDGRFLHDHHESEWMGQPFSGKGFTGYDNMAGHYVSYWFDSMSTGVFSGQGQFDADSNSYQYVSEYTDPTSPDNPTPVRYVMSIDGDDQFTFSWFEDRGEGEMKTMEIVYTRVE